MQPYPFRPAGLRLPSSADPSAANNGLIPSDRPPVLPLPAVAEFLYGQLLAQVSPEALMRAQEFLDSFEVLVPDSRTALTYARLRSQAKQAGVTLPDADYWIGALSLQHRLPLLTMDAHFDLLPDLRPWLLRSPIR